jgi:ankyrin repeat protein
MVIIMFLYPYFSLYVYLFVFPALFKRREVPLHVAAMRGRTGCLPLLLDRGADIEAKDEVHE